MSNKYQNAKIYKLVNTEMPNLVYYGSTCKELNRRLSEHKAPSNTCTSKKLFEVGNPQIILIENFPCSSKIELEQRERYYIENNECLNRIIPSRTSKERYQDNREQRLKNMKQYRELNKERLAERKKQYHQDNREKILEYKKQYRELNKEKLNQKHNCQCGGRFTYRTKSIHCKSKKHMKFIESL